MKRLRKYIFKGCCIAIIGAVAVFTGIKMNEKIQDDKQRIGKVIDSYK